MEICFSKLLEAELTQVFIVLRGRRNANQNLGFSASLLRQVFESRRFPLHVFFIFIFKVTENIIDNLRIIHRLIFLFFCLLHSRNDVIDNRDYSL